MRHTRLFPLALSLSAALLACGPSTPTPGGPPGGTPTAATLALTCSATSVAVGQTLTCTAQATDAQGTPLTTQPTFTFSSSAPARATVTAAGVVTGVSAGSTTVTASAAGLTSPGVTLTVTAGTTPAPSGLTVVRKGSLSPLAIPGFTGPLRADGSFAYTVVEGGANVFYVYENGTSTKLYTAPLDNPYKVTLPGCVDTQGNVVMVGAGKPHLFRRSDSSITPIPFPLIRGDEVDRVICSPDGRIIGSGTDFGADKEYTYAWTPGQSGVTALPVVDNICAGCHVDDANAAGDVLYQNAVLRGGTVTYFNPDRTSGPFRAGAFGSGQTIYGVSSTSTTDPVYLSTWTPAGTTNLINLPRPTNAVQNSTIWSVLEANAAGEVLLLRQYGTNAEPLVLEFWLYRGGALIQVVPPAPYSQKFATESIDDQGRVLALLQVQNDLFAGAIGLIKP